MVQRLTLTGHQPVKRNHRNGHSFSHHEDRQLTRKQIAYMKRWTCDSNGGFWYGVGCTVHVKINGHIALLPNPVGNTAKTSLPCDTILRMHSIRTSLRVSWTKPSRGAYKAEKTRSLRSPRQRPRWNSSARGISLTGSQSWLSFKYLSFLDQSEKSPDSGLATGKYTSNCIRLSFPTRKKKKERLIAG